MRLQPKYKNKIIRKTKVLRRKKVSQVSELVLSNEFEAIREGFIDAIAKYGFNERGDKVKLYSWYVELLRAIADFRIGVVYVHGCSQTGKTLSCTLLVCYCMETLGLNVLWAYDLQASRDIQVPSNFRPVAMNWLESAKKDSCEGAKNNTLFQVGTATTQFTYVSTSDTGKNKGGKAAAGGIAVGVSRDILFKEERSQYPVGAADPLRRRLDAGRISTKPERESGTPGAGLGIEAEVKEADCDFYPFTRCQSCDHEFPLHPKGSLLKPFTVEHPILGTKQAYLTESGRPREWLHSEPSDPVKSAYFGCPYCEAELEDSDRMNAWYQCLKTGIKLADYLEQLPSGIPRDRKRIAIAISPLLRIEQTNTAAEIIEEGLNTHNTADWQQQRLGLPSESGTNSISLELLKSSISAPIPYHQPNVSLGGIDCGRGQHWLVKMDFYLPANYNQLSMAEVIESAVRYVKYVGAVSKTGIVELVADVRSGIVDNEPDRDWSARFCQLTGWSMADQKSGLRDVVKQGIVLDGGVRYPCYSIRNEKFLKTVLNGFVLMAGDGYPLYRFPAEFEKYLANLKSDRNLFRHLTSMQFDPQSGEWQRPSDRVDDFYMAFAFCEVSFYLWLLNQGQSLRIDSWQM